MTDTVRARRIAAAPQVVWDALVDFGATSDWGLAAHLENPTPENRHG